MSDGLHVPDPAVTLRQMVLPRSALKNELLPVGAPGGESTAVENHHSQSHLFVERNESVLGLESSTQRRCVNCCSDPFADRSQVYGRDLQRRGHRGCTLLLGRLLHSTHHIIFHDISRIPNLADLDSG